MKIPVYAKTVVAAVVAGATAVGAAITDSTITGSEWVAIGLAVLTALGVYAVPNAPAKTSTTGEPYGRPTP
jgi:hypothetical protein